MRARACLPLALAALALLPATGAARPGDLDTSFGEDGIVQAPFGGATYVGELALSGDRIVAAGGVDHGTCRPIFLARWLTDGNRDESFGSAGSYSAPTDSCSGPGDGFAGALSVAGDGRIFTAGSGSGGPALLTAHTPSGALDPFLSDDGYVLDDVDGSDAVDLVRLPDGRLVIAGGEDEWAINRYHDGGSPDDSFEGDGRAVYPRLAGGPRDSIAAIIADRDDAVVVVGNAHEAPDPDHSDGKSGIAIGRILADGSLDPDFGTAGRSRVEPDGNEALARDVVRTADGGFVVAGVAQPDRAGHPSILLKFHASGEPDTSFGRGGLVVGPGGTATGVAVDGSGRIVMTVASESFDVTVARYHPDGSADLAFGNGGNIRIPFETGASPVDVAVQPDDKILVAANTGRDASHAHAMTVLRLIGDDPPAPDPGTDDGQIGPGPEALPPPLPPVARPGRVTIRILSSRITRRGVLVRVTWPRGTRGRLVARLRTRARRVVLGRRSVAVLPGVTSRRFRIPLNRRAKRMLRRTEGRLRVRASVRLVG